MDSLPATVTVNVQPPISLRGSSWGVNATTTTLTLDAPSGVEAGDVMLAEVAVRGTPRITRPAGWTAIRSDKTSGQKQSIYYKVATATEPTTYAWAFSRAKPAAGGILDYAGVDTSSPIDAVGGQVNTSSTSLTAPSIVTTANADMLGAFFDVTRRIALPG